MPVEAQKLGRDLLRCGDQRQQWDSPRVKDLSGMDLENRHGEFLDLRTERKKKKVSVDTEENIEERHAHDPVPELPMNLLLKYTYSFYQICSLRET